MIEPRETPKGYAIDLGSLYGYSDGETTGYWWGATGHNTAFKTRAEVIDFFVELVTQLEQAAAASPAVREDDPMTTYTFCPLCGALLEVWGTDGYITHVLERHPESRTAADIRWELDVAEPTR